MDASAFESPIRSNRASSRSACCCTGSGIAAAAIFVRYSSAIEPSFSPSSLRIASICRRRKYSRCCFCAPDLDVVADALPDAQLGQPLLLELQRERQPLDDVERFEQLQLLADVQIGRVAGGIGQGAGMGDRADERADPAIVAAKLENLLDHRAIFALEVARQARRRRHVRALVDLDAQARRPGRCAPRRARPGGAP